MTGDDMLINSIQTIRHPFKLVLWLLGALLLENR